MPWPGDAVAARAESGGPGALPAALWGLRLMGRWSAPGGWHDHVEEAFRRILGEDRYGEGSLRTRAGVPPHRKYWTVENIRALCRSIRGLRFVVFRDGVPAPASGPGEYQKRQIRLWVSKGGGRVMVTPGPHPSLGMEGAQNWLASAWSGIILSRTELQ